MITKFEKFKLNEELHTKVKFSDVDVKDELPRNCYSSSYKPEHNNSCWKSFIAKDGNKYYIGKSPRSIYDQFKVIKSDGEVIGNIAIDVKDDRITGYEFNDSIQVKEEYRRIGIASAMIDYLEMEYNKPYIPTNTVRDEFDSVLNNRKRNEFLNESRVKKHERIKLIDDDKYLLVVPLTDSASCKYGAYTSWCTAAPSSGASIEDAKINTIDSDNKLLYLLNKKYDKDVSIADEYKWKMDEYENGEISHEEMMDFRDEHDDDIYNLEKIAFDVTGRNYNIWDFNNVNMTDDGISLSKLIDFGIDEYVIDKIEEYCGL